MAEATYLPKRFKRVIYVHEVFQERLYYCLRTYTHNSCRALKQIDNGIATKWPRSAGALPHVRQTFFSLVVLTRL